MSITCACTCSYTVNMGDSTCMQCYVYISLVPSCFIGGGECLIPLTCACTCMQLPDTPILFSLLCDVKIKTSLLHIHDSMM